MLRYRFAKEFHVSPFMPMEMRTTTGVSARPASALAVNMQNYIGGERVFDATLDLSRREITAPALARALLAFPCMTASVLAGIYTQALRLWWKRIPFHAHPSKVPAPCR